MIGTYVVPTISEKDNRRFCPVELTFNSKTVQVMALLDSGCTRSVLNDELATQLGIPLQRCSGSGVKLAVAGHPAPVRSLATAPVEVAVGDMTVDYMFDVLHTHHAMLLGADLASVFQMEHINVPAFFPSQMRESVSAHTDQAIEQPSRVAEPLTVPPDKQAELDEALQGCQVALATNASLKQERNSAFICIEKSEVRLDFKNDTEPPWVSPYPIRNKEDSDHVEEETTAWLQAGIIERVPDSETVRCNIPLMVARLRDASGKIIKRRTCGDFRQFNLNLDGLPYTNASVQDTVDRLSKKKLFSELDLKGAFLQFAITQQHRWKASFMVGNKRYRFCGAPLGMKHMSAHCQRILSALFKDLPDVAVYVDNIYIATEMDLARHRALVQEVIRRCNDSNIWLNMEKCLFFRTSILALGHLVSQQGVSLDPKKVQAVMDWEQPRDAEAVQRLLGFVNFLRNNVRHFSDLIAPFKDLKTAKGTSFKWTSTHTAAFATLKRAIATAPLLRFPDCNKPFAVTVDASNRGVGNVLYQPEKAGDLPTADTVVSFRSRSLKQWERQYTPYRLEALGLLFALQCHEDYLRSAHQVQVYMDCRALSFLLQQMGVSKVPTTWLTYFMEFPLHLFHIAAELNAPSDFQSRAYDTTWGISARAQKRPVHVDTPWSTAADSAEQEFAELEWAELSTSGLALEALDAGGRQMTRQRTRSLAELAKQRTTADTAVKAETTVNSAAEVTLVDAVTTKQESTTTETKVEQRRPPPTWARDAHTTAEQAKQTLLATLPSSTTMFAASRAKQDALMAEMQKSQEELRASVPPPTQEQQDIIEDIHSFGHFGVSAVMRRLHLDKRTWPHQHMHVRMALENCEACQAWTRTRHRYALLRDVEAVLPNDRWQMDFISGLGETPMGHKQVLVILDVFTHYVWLFSLKDKTTDTVATVLWQLMSVVGPPKSIQSDNEPTLVTDVVQQIIAWHGAEHRWITAYNPKAMGQVERAIDTISTSLRKLLHTHGGDWSLLVPTVALAVNNRVLEDGTVPFELFFNRALNPFTAFKEYPSDALVAKEEWVKHQIKVREQFFPALVDHRRTARSKVQIHHAATHLRARRIPVGTAVMLRDPNRVSKNDAPYHKYFISEDFGDDTYMLKDEVGAQLRRVPVDHLKVLLLADRMQKSERKDSQGYDAQPSNRVGMKADDGNMYYVDYVGGYRIQDGLKQYKVYWLGFNESEWIVAENCDAGAVREYWAAKSRLPKTKKAQRIIA
jgi:transposase InsO family protein